MNVSYIARNERKYADRRIKQLQKDAKGATHEEKLAVRRAIYGIRKLQKQTYIKNRTPEGRAKALDATIKLRDTVRLLDNTKQGRQNLLTQREINIATSGTRKTFLGGPLLSQAKAKIFYQATRNIWQGLPREARNTAILLGLGETSLKKAVKKVLARNSSAVEYAEKALDFKKSANATFYNSFVQQRYNDSISSPDYLTLVNTIDNSDDLNDYASDSEYRDEIVKALRETLNNNENISDFYNNFYKELNDILTEYKDEIDANGESVEKIKNEVKTILNNNIKESNDQQPQWAKQASEKLKGFTDKHTPQLIKKAKITKGKRQKR